MLSFMYLVFPSVQDTKITLCILMHIFFNSILNKIKSLNETFMSRLFFKRGLQEGPKITLKRLSNGARL